MIIAFYQLTPRLPPTFDRAPPAADHGNRRSGELQGSKLTGEVVHNRRRYMLEMLPLTDWSQTAARPALNLILRRLERMFSKIYKKSSLRVREPMICRLFVCKLKTVLLHYHFLNGFIDSRKSR